MVNINPKGICNKHGVGKLEYGTFTRTRYLCSICNKIRNTKRDIKDIRESTRREIRYLKEQIIKARNKKIKRISNLNEAINIWDSEPILFFNKEIENRKKYEEEHKNEFGGV